MEKKILEVLSDFNPELVEDLERDLIATDTLDSFDIVKLVVELEEAFGIEIDVDDVTPENFQSANTIVALVKRIAEQ